MADLTSQAVRDPSLPTDILSDEDIVYLLAPLKAFKSLLIAVSGGADSVALLVMVQRWCSIVPEPPTVEVATIDHDLRPGSGDEVRWVADHARALGLVHNSKIWTDEKPSSGLQATARSARYRLLLEIAAERSVSGPVAIVTAHTQDDQAETVVMRLARGSGIDGLGAMPASRPLKGDGPRVMLVRPLLGMSKSRLVSFLKSKNQTWLEDPSNASRDFERIRLRQARPHLDALGLTSDAMARSAMRARRARAALEHIASEFLKTHVALNNGIMAKLEDATFQSQPDDVQIRILRHLLNAFGGSSPGAQLSQIEAVHARLAKTPGSLSVTLGGCIVSKQSNRLVVYREAGRAALPVIDLVPGEPRIWDERFKVSFGHVQEKDARTVQVRALDGASFAAIRADLGPNFAQIPVAAAQTLPSFWCEGGLVAVPTMDFSTEHMAQNGPGEAAPDAKSDHHPRAEGLGADKTRQTGHGACKALGHPTNEKASKNWAQAEFLGYTDHGSGT